MLQEHLVTTQMMKIMHYRFSASVTAKQCRTGQWGEWEEGGIPPPPGSLGILLWASPLGNFHDPLLTRLYWLASTD